MQQVQAGTDVELLFLPREEATELLSKFPYLSNCAQARKLQLVQQVDRTAQPAATEIVSDVGGGSSDLTMDADLLSQRLSLMQASIVSIGREMRSRIEGMDNAMFEHMERSDRRYKDTLANMSSRIEQLATSCEHPQRAARASRVAFAPRGGGGIRSNRASCTEAGQGCGSSSTRTGGSSFKSSNSSQRPSLEGRRPSCDSQNSSSTILGGL